MTAPLAARYPCLFVGVCLSCCALQDGGEAGTVVLKIGIRSSDRDVSQLLMDTIS